MFISFILSVHPYKPMYNNKILNTWVAKKQAVTYPGNVYLKNLIFEENL
jgi:hypothetical protein